MAVEESCLTTKDLKVIYKELFELRAKWRRIGMELDLTLGTLDAIEYQCSKPEDLLEKILLEWLKRESANWTQLVDALRSVPVGETKLARQLEKEYCQKGEVTGTKERKQSSGDADQVLSEIKSMEKRFAKLQSTTRESIKQRNVPVVRLVGHLSSYRLFCAVRTREENKYFVDCEKELEKANSIDKIFIIIAPYLSFLDFEILEDIINSTMLGADTDRQNLADYITSLQEFLKSWQVEPCKICQYENEFSNSRVKLCIKLDTVSLSIYRDVKVAIAQILGIEVHALQLCSIEDGYTELCFLFPTRAINTVLPLKSLSHKLSEIQPPILKITLVDEASVDFKNMAKRKIPELAQPIEYKFKRVQLFKSETLGNGSIGAVCKAKCDQLTCAAKLLYPNLFQMQAPNPGRVHKHFYRFEQECRFLSHITHPNIIQYLGTYRDPKTKAPVLLMELMDESLTYFLELSSGDIPYHIQVNLSYDIAQALAFLHTNGIIHRDLSSNNVLLIDGRRAKVTDFGMSKIIDVNKTDQAKMTTCPGTPVYMPPEAFNEPSVYTEKLDNFSLGVIIIQIITRKYPDPTDRFTKKEVYVYEQNHSPFKTTVIVAVSETERRKAHISLIDATHLLRQLVLQCLKYQEADRPTSQQLCKSLGALKENLVYEESLYQDKDQIVRAREDLIKAKDEEIESLYQDKDQIAKAREDLIKEKDEEIKYLKAELQKPLVTSEIDSKSTDYQEQRQYHTKESSKQLQQKIATKIPHQSVELLKTEILGSGTYGGICKAKYNEVTCAAKIFLSGKESTKKEHDKFDEEFQILNQICHPNIVQYLGIYYDPETNAPVLLMELMDESLTHFLESSPGDIPYYIQVNLSYDIAQALAFLHANGIIHRELSSKNVLVLVGSRAKVTHFRLSRQSNPTTKYLDYMPPETLNEPPTCTDKMDCFSFGVLIVQILTKKMPNPTDRFKIIEGLDSIYIEVSEVQRRESHINLISPTHPLRLIALDCLKDHNKSRPSSKELCLRLSILLTPNIIQDCELMKNEIQKLQGELSIASSQVAQAKEQIKMNAHDIEQLENKKSKLVEEIKKLKTPMLPNTGINVHSEHTQCPPPKRVSGSCAVMWNRVYFIEHKSKTVHEYDTEKSLWSTLPEHPLTGFSIVFINKDTLAENAFSSVTEASLATVGGMENFLYSRKVHRYQHTTKEWVKNRDLMNTGRKSPGVVYTQNHVIVVGGRADLSGDVEIMDIHTQIWHTALPLSISKHTKISLAVCEDRTYALAADESQQEIESRLLSISTSALIGTKENTKEKTKKEAKVETEKWRKHQPLDLQQTCLVSVGKTILAIGGKCTASNTISNIYSYFPSDNSWKTVGNMETPQSHCVAACVQNRKVLVVGRTDRKANSSELLSVRP